MGVETIGGWDHQELSHRGSNHRRLSHRRSGPLFVKLSRVKLLRVKPLRVNYHWWRCRRCNVNKRQSHFGGRKNDRLMISKKPPNPVGTEEENQGSKDLIVVQSSRINLCGQWCVELFHSESTSRPVVRRATALIAIHRRGLGRRSSG